ncbi:L-lactate dehydrogenase [Sphingobium sp. SYK-6]|nr:L-lactate dehydrogenase [Sphingobium sp. SYK-6]
MWRMRARQPLWARMASSFPTMAGASSMVAATASALPGIVDEVGDRLTVLVDGGVRSGLDVVRMLALGARGVLLGRAWAYALAARGEAGVIHMLELIEAEMRVAMTLGGVGKIDGLDRSSLSRMV